MRAGYVVSVVGHLAILGFGYFGLPDAAPLQAEAIDALPVDLVTVSDVTDLLEGDKKSKELPTEKPQPKPVAEAEAPSPEPAEKPAEKPVEAAQAPAAAPPPPPPEPEPEVEPEPEPLPEPEQVASLPEPSEEPPPEPAAEPLPEPEPAPEAEAEPEAAPEPKPAVAAPPRPPKARPKPPKQVTQPKPDPKPEPNDPLRELALKSGEEFNPDDISALLNKQQPAGGGDPTPATEPQTLGSTTGNADAAMTQSWLAALTSKLAQCWQPPIGVREAQNLLVSVEFRLAPDGTLSGTPVVLNAGFDPLSQIAAETAVRAIARCEPYADIFPAEHYGVWGQSITVDFDPRRMFGAG